MIAKRIDQNFAMSNGVECVQQQNYTPPAEDHTTRDCSPNKKRGWSRDGGPTKQGLSLSLADSGTIGGMGNAGGRQQQFLTPKSTCRHLLTPVGLGQIVGRGVSSSADGKGWWGVVGGHTVISSNPGGAVLRRMGGGGGGVSSSALGMLPPGIPLSSKSWYVQIII